MTWSVAPPQPDQQGGPARPAGPEPAEFVFAPAHPQVLGGRKDVVFEVRRLADGTAVLPVFSTVQKLVAALGEAQPWACLPLREVRGLMGLSRVEQVLIDPDLDQGAWRWRETDLLACAKSINDGEEDVR
jgi:hypothetical protein